VTSHLLPSGLAVRTAPAAGLFCFSRRLSVGADRPIDGRDRRCGRVGPPSRPFPTRRAGKPMTKREREKLALAFWIGVISVELGLFTWLS